MEKILILEDDPEVLAMLSRLVRERTPHKVVATNNPFEAMGMVRAGGVGLVISEVKLPALDGLDLLLEIKAFDEDTPVVFISSIGGIDLAMEAMERGAFCYIQKPFRLEQMLFAIERALEWRGQRKELTALRGELLAKEAA